MTKDQLIGMAIEAGIVNKWARNDPSWSVDDADLERFASLVAAQAAAEEREKCAKVCDVTPPYPFRPSIEAAHAIRDLGERT